MEREGIRVVWSAWDGVLDPGSEINFLEHHDNGVHFSAKGVGPVCPVTNSSEELRFCDAFGCTNCFDRVTRNAVSLPTISNLSKKGTPVRTRDPSLLRSKERECG